MDRKEAILQAATQLFAEKGFDATPTSEVAKKAGVAEGLIFHHFKTKNELLIHIFKENVDFYTEHIKSEAEKADTGLKAIENILRFSFTFMKEKTTENLILLRDIPHQFTLPGSPYREVFLSRISRILNIFAYCIDRGKADRSIRDLSSEKVAHFLLGIFSGLVREQLMSPLEIPDISAEVIDFCRRGLAGKHEMENK